MKCSARVLALAVNRPRPSRLFSTSSPLFSSSPSAVTGNQLPSFEDQKYARLDTRKRRLLFRSKERGMLETDLILGTFALKHLDSMNEKQLGQFEAILDCIDPDLLLWITKKAQPPTEIDNEMLRSIQEHTFNNPLGYRGSA